MNESSIFWMLAPEIIAAFILVIGFITSRRLPEKDRKTYIRKFAGVSLAVIFFCLPFSGKPYISSFSGTSYLFKEQKAENLISVEEIAKYEKDQTENIKLLKEEVEELRKELRLMNNFYGNTVQMFSLLVVLGCLFFSFTNKEGKGLEEINKDQIMKL